MGQIKVYYVYTKDLYSSIITTYMDIKNQKETKQNEHTLQHETSSRPWQSTNRE
jgi:hypothetical protein